MSVRTLYSSFCRGLVQYGHNLSCFTRQLQKIHTDRYTADTKVLWLWIMIYNLNNIQDFDFLKCLFPDQSLIFWVHGSFPGMYHSESNITRRNPIMQSTTFLWTLWRRWKTSRCWTFKHMEWSWILTGLHRLYALREIFPPSEVKLTLESRVQIKPLA